MLQHQLGAAQRSDTQRLNALLDENAVLAGELARAQTRNTQLSHDSANQATLQRALVQQLRADLIKRDERLSIFQSQLRALESAMPDLALRYQQAQELALQANRIHALERSLLLSQQENERRGRLIDAQGAELKRLVNSPDGKLNNLCAEAMPPTLTDRAVLCVGGRTASVPLYRRIIERTGGRFMHHDGGEEESLTKLDSTLAAADLVICQTGCISHNAYWRVKDYCKRTGKQCVYVENPGTAGIKRALSSLSNQ